MQIFTIGFTRSSAEHFFARLKQAGVARLIDIRLNTRSQLAGFAKADDLAFFARKLCGIETLHRLDLAPTPEMLAAYRERRDWRSYERAFRRLLARRKIERLDSALFDGACLLCSESLPHHCHRRLVAEHLAGHWPGVVVTHL